MRFEHPHDPITWICADVRKMPLNDRSVDLAFDKGTLDTLISACQGDSAEVAKKQIREYIDEVSDFPLVFHPTDTSKGCKSIARRCFFALGDIQARAFCGDTF